MAGEGILGFTPKTQRAQIVERKEQVRMIAFFVAIVGFCCVASASTVSIRMFGFPLPPICVFKMITGLDCPGCGVTRALVLAFHGHLQESYMMHIWGIPLALFFAVKIVLGLARLNPGFRLPIPTPLLWKQWGARFVFFSLLAPWAAKTVALLVIQHR